MAESSDYLILGAGVFGASAALHLIRAEPRARITLVDRNAAAAPIRVAASWDWNKVVRADYADIEYMRLALEAKERWAADPLWAPFYHESGASWVSPSDFSQVVRENYKALGVESGLEALSVEQARKEFGGVFEGGDFTGVREVFVNRKSGWGEAKEALEATIAEAVKLGVRYVTAEVARLEFDGEGATTGVVTTEGERIAAGKVVLSTGAYTAQLLADSGRAEVLAGERFVAAAVTEGFAPVEDEKLYGGPVGISMVPPDRGASNGSVPHSGDKTLKFWGQIIFRNTQPHANGSQISRPPSAPDYAQLDVPTSLREDVDFAGKSIYGKLSDNWKVENYRICWEAVSPSEDFIISPHSGSKNLYVATIGSFHGWKFLPVLGKYVVQMLQGTLEEKLAKKWAWNKTLVPPTHSAWPRKELIFTTMKSILLNALVSGIIVSHVAASPMDELLGRQATCARDNCFRALVGSKPGPASASADCSSFMQVTQTPCPSTVTETATITSFTTTLTNPYPGLRKLKREEIEARQAVTTSASSCTPSQNKPSSMPSYIQTACQSTIGTLVPTARYSSACSCNGITAATTTLPASTVTVTTTSTVLAAYTPTNTPTPFILQGSGDRSLYVTTDTDGALRLVRDASVATPFYVDNAGLLRNYNSPSKLLMDFYLPDPATANDRVLSAEQGAGGGSPSGNPVTYGFGYCPNQGGFVYMIPNNSNVRCAGGYAFLGFWLQTYGGN
ncbi:FAD dependent oxidoreductase [Colletotrichum gloeosporioides Cg-14]|uniref:FAD dependent oxidoreductase n=1 Tax=Colletotrichum gloeosporioides (strain Cg-14) TaxID=1237896 RepID=T0JP02_COLGC|nr:FAD dependent oxidoreductase [Colletotrichum gloeosporioides Cg-14]